MATEFTLVRDGVTLSGEESGEGPPVVLLHGLTATRRYVVMGSTALPRGGHRVISYDARGHGRSGAAAPSAYTYPELLQDLLALLDARGVERAVLAGASMGAHTLLGFALAHPSRVAGLVVITPAYDGELGEEGGARLTRWDRLADGLAQGGVDGFIEAYGPPAVDSEKLQQTLLTVIRQRLSQHEHPQALADALRGVPRSRPFGAVAELAALDVPVAIIGSNDAADPEHPLAVAEQYASTIPGARLITDPPGSSPVAWQGSQVSRVIAEVVKSS